METKQLRIMPNTTFPPLCLQSTGDKTVSVPDYDSLFPLDNDKKDDLLKNLAQIITSDPAYIERRLVNATWLYKPFPTKNTVDETNTDTGTASISDDSGSTSSLLDTAAETPMQQDEYAELYESALDSSDTPFPLSVVSDETWPILLSDALRQEECKLLWLSEGRHVLNKQLAQLQAELTSLHTLTNSIHTLDTTKKEIADIEEATLSPLRETVENLRKKVTIQARKISSIKPESARSASVESLLKPEERALFSEQRTTAAVNLVAMGDYHQMIDDTEKLVEEYMNVVDGKISETVIFPQILHQCFDDAKRRAQSLTPSQIKIQSIRAKHLNPNAKDVIGKTGLHLNKYPNILKYDNFNSIKDSDEKLISRLFDDAKEVLVDRLRAKKAALQNSSLPLSPTQFPSLSSYVTVEGKPIQEPTQFQREIAKRRKEKTEALEQVEVQASEQLDDTKQEYKTAQDKLDFETAALVRKQFDCINLADQIQQKLRGLDPTHLTPSTPPKDQVNQLIEDKQNEIQSILLPLENAHADSTKSRASVVGNVTKIRDRYHEVFTPERSAFLQQVFRSSFTDDDGNILPKSTVLQLFFDECVSTGSPALTSYEKTYIKEQISAASLEKKQKQRFMFTHKSLTLNQGKIEKAKNAIIERIEKSITEKKPYDLHNILANITNKIKKQGLTKASKILDTPPSASSDQTLANKMRTLIKRRNNPNKRIGE